MARTSLAPTIICDAGPLIHLDEIGCLDLLSDFHAVLVPGPVWQEVARHRATVLEQEIVALARVDAPLSDDVGLQVLVRALALDAGEQAALACMRLYPEAILLTDDAAARLAADQLGMRVHGTLGVLLRAIRRGQRTTEEVIALLEQIPQRTTLYIRTDLLRSVIAQVREASDLTER
jgi:predicted nucleic acid-binding protein